MPKDLLLAEMRALQARVRQVDEITDWIKANAVLLAAVTAQLQNKPQDDGTVPCIQHVAFKDVETRYDGLDPVIVADINYCTSSHINLGLLLANIDALGIWLDSPDAKAGSGDVETSAGNVNTYTVEFAPQYWPFVGAYVLYQNIQADSFSTTLKEAILTGCFPQLPVALFNTLLRDGLLDTEEETFITWMMNHTLGASQKSIPGDALPNNLVCD